MISLKELKTRLSLTIRIAKVKYQLAYGNRLRYYWFIFKWFLIGKYHCEVPYKYKPYYWFIHKSLWLFIIESVVLNTLNLLGVH